MQMEVSSLSTKCSPQFPICTSVSKASLFDCGPTAGAELQDVRTILNFCCLSVVCKLMVGYTCQPFLNPVDSQAGEAGRQV